MENSLDDPLREKVVDAILTQHLTPLYFIEDVIDRRELQNAFLTSGSALKKHKTEDILFPFSIKAFNFNKSGKLLSLDLKKLRYDPDSNFKLSFRLNEVRSEIIKSLHADDDQATKKISPIFWDLWDLIDTKIKEKH
jgi:hypothetical protein